MDVLSTRGSDRPPGQLACARCGYDLRGLDADGRCPECAFPIRRSRGIHRSAWTVALGVRRAIVHLCLAGPAAAAIIFGALWLARAPLAWLHAHATARALVAVGLLSIPLAVPVEWLLARRLRERAGMSGHTVSLLAIAAVIAAVGAGGAAAVHLVGVPSRESTVVAVTVILVTAAWIIIGDLAD